MTKKLELNKETLRDLADDALGEVAGGNGGPTNICGGDSGTLICPSGATWFASCESTWVTCG